MDWYLSSANPLCEPIEIFFFSSKKGGVLMIIFLANKYTKNSPW